MAAGSFRFDRFRLDPADRLLARDGDPVALNARYLDALTLLVSEQGRLVSKDRFLEEVWRGVPVTDEALTQCIRTLRRLLGDDAAAPRFIETVPKHGYRFVAPVTLIEAQSSPRLQPRAWRRLGVLGAAGMFGGGLAGALGGLVYGFVGASEPLQPGVGAASVLLVLICASLLVGMVGGAGVGFGIAAADLASRSRGLWSTAGGALGGLVVGAFAKLLGLDAFNLLLGRSPGDMAGAAEGALLGGALGLAAWLTSRRSGADHLRRSIAMSGLAGGAAGLVIALLGGHLMGGSLDLLAREFPGSRLRLNPIGALLGETGFGPISLAVTASLEGALFGACIAGSMVLARRSLMASEA